jgi:hypothetical protein
LIANGPNDSRILAAVAAPAGNTSPSISDLGGQDFLFGSFHPGVLNMLLGDGTVLSYSSELNPTLFWQLSQVNDGESVSITGSN